MYLGAGEWNYASCEPAAALQQRHPTKLDKRSNTVTTRSRCKTSSFYKPIQSLLPVLYADYLQKDKKRCHFRTKEKGTLYGNKNDEDLEEKKMP